MNERNLRLLGEIFGEPVLRQYVEKEAIAALERADIATIKLLQREFPLFVQDVEPAMQAAVDRL